MLNNFQSERGKVIEIIIKDGSGSVIDHTVETISDIEFILLNKFDGSVIEKFSREQKEDFTQAETTAEHMLCHVNSLNATAGHIEAQINLILPNDKVESGKSVMTYKGILFDLKQAYNG